MSKVHVSQVQRVFKGLYEDKIVISNAKSEKEKSDLFFTRSLSAYTVKMLSNASLDESVCAVTDDYNDNGLDFVFVDKESNLLLVGQSKWTYDGQKSPEFGDTLKALKGFNDLLDCKFENFNKKINEIKDDIINLIENTDCRLIFALSYSGIQPVSEQINKALLEQKENLNDISDIFDFNIINLSKLHQSIAYVGKGLPINVDVKVNNYGIVEEPLKGVYGCIDATEVFNWYNEYGEFIFEKNLRKFITDSNINNAVQKTLFDAPEKFWYFNNGITYVIVCTGKSNNRIFKCYDFIIHIELFTCFVFISIVVYLQFNR